MLAKILIIVGLASAGLLFVLFTVTTPANAGAFGILMVFLLGYIVATVVTTFVILLLERLTRKLAGEFGSRKTKSEFTLRKAYYYASVVALAPIIFVSLQSVGGVGLYEIILVAILVVLGCVYIAKRSH